MNIISMSLTALATFSACGYCMYKAHKITKDGKTKNMSSLERFELSVMVGFPIGVILIIIICLISLGLT